MGPQLEVNATCGASAWKHLRTPALENSLKNTLLGYENSELWFWSMGEVLSKGQPIKHSLNIVKGTVLI